MWLAAPARGVTTIVKLANDIAGALKATSRNRKSCEKLAERVGDIGDLLKGLDTSSPSTVAATRRLVSRLEKALRRALLLVTSCQASSRIYSLVAGGWQADQFDKVNAEIDRCLLDLSLSSLALVSSIDHKLNAAAAGERNTEVVAVQVAPEHCSHGHDQDDGKDKMASGAGEKNGAPICYGGEQDGKTETDAGEVPTTIGVPATTACAHYQLSPPPPPRCYGYHLHCCHCTHGHCHCAGGHYSPSCPWYSDDSADVRLRHMFSDENPNACSIM
uniref:MCAfunc domain-containing protein n=1 Tax=Oryza punctata TaxID=4537 RepID=A0A0E0MI20_ORYPU